MSEFLGEYFFNRSTLNKFYVTNCLKVFNQTNANKLEQWDNNENFLMALQWPSTQGKKEEKPSFLFSQDGRFCLCFMGEIYNGKFLQQQISNFLPRNKPITDNEIVLYGLIHLGIAGCLKLMDGIFALAFYDNSRNILILARDRVGVAPLYVGYGSEGIVFGSKYDHVIHHKLMNGFGFDAKGIFHYLFLGYMPENEGVIKSSGMLPHGHFLEIKTSGFVLNCYYDFPVINSGGNKPVKLEEWLIDSVYSRMDSNLPGGVFLSNGVDSKLVSKVANDFKKTKAFTIGVNAESMDESLAASLFCYQHKIEQHIKQFSINDFTKYADLHFKAFSAPLADFSSIPMLMLAELANKKTGVALTGDGGDELFWGYNRNIKALRLLPYYEKGIFNRRMKLIVSKLKNKNRVEFFRHWNSDNFISYYYSTLAISGAVRWLPEIMEPIADRPFFYPKNFSQIEDENFSVVEKMLLIRKMEIDIHLQRILEKVYHSAKYFNLKVRTPFLSNTFLDNAIYFNHADCIKGDTGKMNLKQLLIQLTNDPSVLQPKKGFTIPLHTWMRSEMRKEVTETILDMPTKLAVNFNQKKLNKMLARQKETNSSSAAWFIWALYVLVKWNEKFN